MLLTVVPGRRAQRVDAAHVAQHAPAEVVNVVEVDRVVLGEAFGVSPTPADRDAGVEEVGDVVVGDLVVAALADPHADRAGEDASAGVDDVVVDRDVVCAIRFVGLDRAFTDANATGSQIVEVVLGRLGSRDIRGETRSRRCPRAPTSQSSMATCRVPSAMMTAGIVKAAWPSA